VPFAVARYLIVTAGRSANARALPLYLAIGIASVVLFGGNGIDARTVTGEAERRLGFRVALLGVWWLCAFPVTRAWLGDRASLTLRVLPVSRRWVLGALAAGCLVIQLPWAVLWLRGASVGAAAWALTAALALSVAPAAGVRSVLDALGVGVAVVSHVIGPHWALAAACAVVFWRSLALAHGRAPEPASGGGHWVVGGSRALAYATAMAVAALRGHAPVFTRALFMTLASGLLPALYIRQNGGAVLLWALSFWGPVCVFAATAIAGPLLRVDSGLAWVARVHGAEAAAARALWGLCALWGAVTGAAFALVMGLVLGLELQAFAGLVAACVGGGIAWALAALFGVQHSTRGGAERAGRLLVIDLALAIGSVALAWALLPQH
jgi:hypothetical protein